MNAWQERSLLALSAGLGEEVFFRGFLQASAAARLLEVRPKLLHVRDFGFYGFYLIVLKFVNHENPKMPPSCAPQRLSALRIPLFRV